MPMSRPAWIGAALVAFALCSACGADDPGEERPKIQTPDIYTPRWAFEPWISKDISDDVDSRAFVRGFVERDIPVGVLVIDSPWETDYNTFIPNPNRYPAFDRLVQDLREQDVRIVLWVTQMINEASFDSEPGGDSYEGPSIQFQTAKAKGYLVNDGETYFWWKGVGGGLDFFNEEAVDWWHRQQDELLSLGINGFKLDFGENYLPGPTLETAAGPVSHQAYSEEYYRDFWAYGVSKTSSEDFVTMVRPYDKSYQFEGRFFARPEHAPVAWVGDNRRDWVGLVDALDHIFRSAQAGYAVVGSDIGGYLDRDDLDLLSTIPFDPDVFLRWIALGAMTPFMQLHGRANLEPWAVPEKAQETIRAYRYWATLHHELVPFFYSLARGAREGQEKSLTPVGAEPQDWVGDWRYLLGEAFLVAPMFAPGATRDVLLPEEGPWYDWWSPGADPLPAGTLVEAYRTRTGDEIPIFVRAGAIIPLSVSSTITGLAPADGHGALLIWPRGEETRFTVYDDDGGTTEVRAGGGASVSITLSRSSYFDRLRIRVDAKPGEVAVSGRKAQEGAPGGASPEGTWWFESETRSVWVALPAVPQPQTITLR